MKKEIVELDKDFWIIRSEAYPYLSMYGLYFKGRLDGTTFDLPSYEPKVRERVITRLLRESRTLSRAKDPFILRSILGLY